MRRSSSVRAPTDPSDLARALLAQAATAADPGPLLEAARALLANRPTDPRATGTEGDRP